ncbi:putative uncharacterized protein FLJ37770 [Centruroides sculpturatus]|uniref:putative uncharacterized protein FLJ37770 n=1 Tax=Centruroides sculpturatus TaxID=218467 RepID=UPI000C6E847A|nr:putative uncharacterized protein FLJ37770 [Centruroides sculpturatus]
MQRTIEQRFSIKFCVKLNKSGIETLDMIREAYKDESMSRTRVFEWHKKFKDGRGNVEDEQRAGCPTATGTDENMAKVRELLRIRVRCVRKEIADTWMPHHDNAPNHMSLVVREALAKQRVNAAPTTLQSRRGSPDFFLFPRIKGA